MEAFAPAFESTQLIVPRYSQVLEFGGVMQVQKLASRNLQVIAGKHPRDYGAEAAKHVFGQPISEAFYHVPMLSEIDNNDNRRGGRHMRAEISYVRQRTDIRSFGRHSSPNAVTQDRHTSDRGMHMNIIESRPRYRAWVMALTLGALAASCSKDPILGVNGIAAALVPQVTAVTPLNGAKAVPTNTLVTATLNEAVNPITGTASMTVTCVTPCVNPAGTVTLDATNTIATFTLKAGTTLTSATVYTATITGATSLVGGIAMAAPYTWQFTTVAPALANPLASAATFGTFGGSAGMTNSGILTVVNGDIGTTAASTLVTGFHDSGAGCTYTEVLGANVGNVTGLIYTAPPPPTVACPTEGTAATFAIAQQARADALTAYNALVALPAGPDPGAGNLANLVLAPGDYTAAAGTFMIQGGDLTLDAKGDANAVFVFQMATTLTVGGPGAAFPQSVILVNGAQAKNVYWQVGSAATINAAGGGTMVGTIIAQAGAAFSTAGNTAIVTLNGRVLSLNASVTLVDTVINVPGP
jgi:hypothetical protein